MSLLILAASRHFPSLVGIPWIVEHQQQIFFFPAAEMENATLTLDTWTHCPLQPPTRACSPDRTTDVLMA